MEKSDGESSRSAGQPCPALQKLQGSKNKSAGTGGELQDFHTTLTELAAAIHSIKERVESAPAGVHLGRALAVVRAGLKFVAVALLAAGVGVGLGDGNLFDDVGPNCAQQPSWLIHGAGARQAGEQPGGKSPGAAGGNGSGSDGDGAAGQPKCVARAKICVYRLPDGRCEATGQPCGCVPRLAEGHQGKSEMLKAETLKLVTEIHQGVQKLEQGQEKIMAATMAKAENANQSAEIEPVSDSEAMRVFALMKALDDGQRNRKAPLGRVFRLLVLEGLSQAATAKQCGCSPGLVSSRVAEIQRRMKRPVTELRALASRLGELDVAADDSRARKIYRRGMTDDSQDET